MIDVVDVDVGQAIETCPECDRRALYVSYANVPRVGPLRIPGFEVCEERGAAFYHPTDDD